MATRAAEPIAALPELASVPWRPPRTLRSLRRWGLVWTAWTLLYVIPFSVAGVVLPIVDPITVPVALACLAHAWLIPELYAFRGASVVNPKGPRNEGSEDMAQGLLGDLLAHDPRELQRRTGLALERAGYGTWLVGEAGALLVPPGGRRVHCFCVRVPEGDLPPSDRVAHLLLALRTDEVGFATVANHAFAGAPWRVRRRMRANARPALDAAVAAARSA
jgi:hypothetical protein